MDLIVSTLAWFALVSAGIMAGVYFTFSVFAMRAFAESGARAMQSINRVIQQSAFLPLFFLSTAGSAILAVLGLLGHAGQDAGKIIAGGTVYVLGMFAVTVAGNVPLNNRLDAADAASLEGQAVWRDRWTRFNHLRTVACTAAMVLLAMGLAER